MSDFLSVIEGIGKEASTAEAEENGTKSVNEDTQEIVIDEKDLEDQVNDLVEIRKKDLLRKNLLNIVRENLTLKQRLKVLESKLAEQSTNNDSYNLLFRIDMDGDEIVDTEIVETETNFILTHAQEEDTETVEEAPKKSGGNKCFNCLGDHMIADCPLPRNPREINKNKKEFQNSSANFNSARYHIDEKQKFGHVRPGLPSDKLQKALGLKSDQVPEYIYRMRSIGYPPGWLNSAKISTSGINLYHNRDEKLAGVGEEEGEVQDKLEYDITKLVEWPGFNSAVPEKFRDETHKYRVPSLSRVKLLKEMTEELRPKQQKEQEKKQSPAKVEEAVGGNDTIVLDATIELDSDTDLEDSTRVVEETDEAEAGKAEETKAEAAGEGEEGEAMETEIVTSTPPRRNFNTVAKTETGTPICEVYSPFVKLPSQKTWGKDMSEHVAFENLPNYTGKWEQMRGLLKQMRKKDLTDSA